MLYKHPHKRGFSAGIEREGLATAYVMIWCWEWRLNWHHQFMDKARQYWETRIAVAEARAASAEAQLSVMRASLAKHKLGPST